MSKSRKKKGTYDVWSTSVDRYVMRSVAREEIVKMFLEKERARIEEEMGKIDSGELDYRRFRETGKIKGG